MYAETADKLRIVLGLTHQDHIPKDLEDIIHRADERQKEMINSRLDAKMISCIVSIWEFILSKMPDLADAGEAPADSRLQPGCAALAYHNGAILDGVFVGAYGKTMARFRITGETSVRIIPIANIKPVTQE